MNTGFIFSQEIDKLTNALLCVQNERVLIDKDAKSYTNKYTKLDYAVREAQPILARHGLVVTQDYSNVDGNPSITTLVAHPESGQWKVATLTFHGAGMAKVNDAQDYFAGSSYARRYAYLGAIGWVSTDDTDGNFKGDKKPGNGKPKNDEPKEIDPYFMAEAEKAKNVDELRTVCGKWKADAKKNGWMDGLGAFYAVRENELTGK